MSILKNRAHNQSKHDIRMEVFNELVSEFSNAEIGGSVALTRTLFRLKDKIDYQGLQEEVSQSLSGKNLNRFTKWRSPIQDKKLIRREVFNELVDEFTSEELAGNQVLIKALLRMRKKIDPQADLQETKNLLTGSGSSLDRVLTRLRKNIENEN